ncbi:hypothetical protein NE237_019123 [Protea cynaroides]|uniref:Uncharacterized protein n=1 Tax=Protea cynaroides TaxID=273540 RepID=A0A9Q0QPT2_9MAGN|nr:hypothetical protein NE237_019123 [Protea cynaroides]
MQYRTKTRISLFVSSFIELFYTQIRSKTIYRINITEHSHRNLTLKSNEKGRKYRWKPEDLTPDLPAFDNETTKNKHSQEETQNRNSGTVVDQVQRRGKK